jgi:DNA helicase-2/ATP-dependent DNA helicase PcrA
MDFDDLLLYTNVLFSRFPEVLARYREQFPYILVDEYQDTNLAQYLIIKNLALEHRNIAVVGDDAQSIYAFRGARIENILNFSKDSPKQRNTAWELNYRSTQTVVDAANSLIKHNIRRMPIECFSRAEVGDKIELLSAYTDAEEAFMSCLPSRRESILFRCLLRGVCHFIQDQCPVPHIGEALRKRKYAVQGVRRFSFYERAEVKDMMAYLRLIVNEKDDEAFKRVINEPARGFGPVSLQKIICRRCFFRTFSL